MGACTSSCSGGSCLRRQASTDVKPQPVSPVSPSRPPVSAGSQQSVQKPAPSEDVVHDFSKDLDPATRNKLLAAQLHRGHQACHAVDDCVAGAMPDVQQLLRAPLQAVRGLQKATELFAGSLGMARLIDAVDATCMLAAGIAAIAAQGPLSNLPAAITVCSHLEACAHAVAARLADPQSVLRGFKPHQPQPHSPFAPKLDNAPHLWHLSLLWLRINAVGTDPGVGEKVAADSSAPYHRHHMLASLPSTLEEGSDPSLDAEAAVQTVYKHVKAMISSESSTCNEDSASRAWARRKKTFVPDADDDSNSPNISMRRQMLQLVKESALTPSAVLQQQTIVHFLSMHFLHVEFVPCDVIMTTLREGLEKACSTTPPGTVPGVTNPSAALELLKSSQKDLSHELVALSNACTCSGAQHPLVLDTAFKKLLPAEASSIRSFTEEVQRVSSQTLDGQPFVYVGALSRAFPASMTFDNALTCIIDLAQSNKQCEPGIASSDGLLPTTWRTAATTLSPGGGVSPTDAMSTSDGGRLLADDDAEKACAYMTPSLRRSSARSQEDGLSGSTAVGSSVRGLSSFGTSFWSPRTTLTEGDAFLAESLSVSTLRGAPERTAEAARLLAEHGGWMSECSHTDNSRFSKLFLDFDKARPAGLGLGVLESGARKDDIASIVHLVTKGTPVSLVCGVEGIGKTHTLYQASVALLQSRAWTSVRYVRTCQDCDDILGAIAVRQCLSIPAWAPDSFRTAMVARSFPTTQNCGIVVDNITDPAQLTSICRAATELNRANSYLQIVLVARIDSGHQIPATLPGVHLAPLSICTAEALLSQAVAVHLHERLAIPHVQPAFTTQDSSSAPSRPCSGNAHVPNSTSSANMRETNSSSHQPTDVSELVPRIVELAREGLQLCRGVPLLLHVLGQVAVSCMLCQDSHAACSALHANFAVLQRSTTAPLRLTSLVVRQVYACLAAQLGQASMAGAHQSGVLALRVLESCTSKSCAKAVPHSVRLARHSFDDAAVPLQLISSLDPILSCPAARFLTATFLWHSGCAHTAHALIASTARQLVQKVASLRTLQHSGSIQEVMQLLHMALSVQGAALLPSTAVTGLATALQGMGTSSSSIHILVQASHAWLLMDSAVEDALLACPPAVQPASLSAGTKFAVAHVRAVALARISINSCAHSEGAPTLHQALERLNTAVRKDISSLNRTCPDLAVSGTSSGQGPLEVAARRATGTCSPFLQPSLTALLRVLILRELHSVHETLAQNAACGFLRRLMHALCATSSADAIETHLSTSKQPVESTERPRKKLLMTPAWQTQLMSMTAVGRSSSAVTALLTLPALPDEPILLSGTRESNSMSKHPVMRPYFMRAVLSQLCEAEAAASVDHLQCATWHIRGLMSLLPCTQMESMRSSGSGSGDGQGGVARVGNGSNIGQAVRTAIHSALLSDGRCGAVRMLLALASALKRRWPGMGNGDIAIAASYLLSTGRLDAVPDVAAAWEAARDISSKAKVDGNVLRCMQALHIRVSRSKASATTQRQHNDFHLKLPKPRAPHASSAPLPHLLPSEQDGLSSAAHGHTTPILTPDRSMALTRPAARSGFGACRAPRGSALPPIKAHAAPVDEEEGDGSPHGQSISFSPSGVSRGAGCRLDGPDGSIHGSLMPDDSIFPGLTEHNSTSLRHGVPGSAPEHAAESEGSALAPCSSSEVWLSTSEDLEDMSSMSGISSDGKSSLSGTDAGDGALDGEAVASFRNRAGLTTGLLPTVAEEPGGEDVTSPSVSQGSGSSDGRVFSAPRSVSITITPQGFGSTLTGSMHSGTSPLQSVPTGSIGDAAPTSMDSGDMRMSPKDSYKTADLNVFPSEALAELTATVLENSSNSPDSDTTYVSCKSSTHQKDVSPVSIRTSGDDSPVQSAPTRAQLTSINCEDLEPPTAYASNDEHSSMSSVAAEPHDARAAAALGYNRSMATVNSSSASSPGGACNRAVAAFHSSTHNSSPGGGLNRYSATGNSSAGNSPVPGLVLPDISTNINWLCNPSSSTSASTLRDSVSDSFTSTLGSLPHKMGQKGDKSQSLPTQIPEIDLSSGIGGSVPSGGLLPLASSPHVALSSASETSHSHAPQQAAGTSAPPSPSSPSGVISPAEGHAASGSTHIGPQPLSAAAGQTAAAPHQRQLPQLALTCPHTVTTGMGQDSESPGALHHADLVAESHTAPVEAAPVVQQHAGAIDVSRMAIAPDTNRLLNSGGEYVDTLSDLSTLLDSTGNQAVCLRNQPRLPKTAFLSTTPFMLLQYMGSDGPMSTHTTPRSVGDVAGLVGASPGGSIIRGSSAFDSALRSDEEAAPQASPQGAQSPQNAYPHAIPVTQRAAHLGSNPGVVPSLLPFMQSTNMPGLVNNNPGASSPPPIRRGGADANIGPVGPPVITTGQSCESSAFSLTGHSANFIGSAAVNRASGPSTVPPRTQRGSALNVRPTVTTGAVASAAQVHGPDPLFLENFSLLSPLSADNPLTSRSAPGGLGPATAAQACTVTTGAPQPPQPTPRNNSLYSSTAVSPTASSHSALPIFGGGGDGGGGGGGGSGGSFRGRSTTPAAPAHAPDASRAISGGYYIPLDILPSSSHSSIGMPFDVASSQCGAIDQLLSTHGSPRTVTTGAISPPISPQNHTERLPVPSSAGLPASSGAPACIPRLPLHGTAGISAPVRPVALSPGSANASGSYTNGSPQPPLSSSSMSPAGCGGAGMDRGFDRGIDTPSQGMQPQCATESPLDGSIWRHGVTVTSGTTEALLSPVVRRTPSPPCFSSSTPSRAASPSDLQNHMPLQPARGSQAPLAPRGPLLGSQAATSAAWVGQTPQDPNGSRPRRCASADGIEASNNQGFSTQQLRRQNVASARQSPISTSPQTTSNPAEIQVPVYQSSSSSGGPAGVGAVVSEFTDAWHRVSNASTSDVVQAPRASEIIPPQGTLQTCAPPVTTGVPEGTTSDASTEQERASAPTALAASSLGWGGLNSGNSGYSLSSSAALRFTDSSAWDLNSHSSIVSTPKGSQGGSGPNHTAFSGRLYPSAGVQLVPQAPVASHNTTQQQQRTLRELFSIQPPASSALGSADLKAPAGAVESPRQWQGQGRMARATSSADSVRSKALKPSRSGASSAAIETCSLDGVTHDAGPSSASGSITMPILCEDGNITGTTAGTKPPEPYFLDAEKVEKFASPTADTAVDAAKVSDHSVDLDPSYSQDCTQETTRGDRTTSTSLQMWQQQHVATNSHSGRAVQAGLDSSDNLEQGQLSSLGISDDLGAAGAAAEAAIDACMKADSAAVAAADQSIMSSIDSPVHWRDNETAGALWLENPLAACGNDTMSSDASRIQAAQRTITGSSLSTVVRSPLVDGVAADGLASLDLK